MDALDLIRTLDFCRSRLHLSETQDSSSLVNSPLSDNELKKFIYSAINKKICVKDSRKLIGLIAGILESENPWFTREVLEKFIMSYQIKQRKLRIVWQECDEIRAGHGVVLYDKNSPDASGYSQQVAYIEGYSFRQTIERGGKLPLKGYCIKPNEVTTVDIIDEMKYRIEELMKFTMPEPNSEIIPDRIYTDLNC